MDRYVIDTVEMTFKHMEIDTTLFKSKEAKIKSHQFPSHI